MQDDQLDRSLGLQPLPAADEARFTARLQSAFAAGLTDAGLTPP